jgi:gamma-glutamylcysteine synthetase
MGQMQERLESYTVSDWASQMIETTLAGKKNRAQYKQQQYEDCTEFLDAADVERRKRDLQ